MISHLKRYIIFTTILFSFINAVYADELEAGLVNPGYEEQPSWFKKSFLDLPEDVSEARENDKRLLIFFYQDGCPYCKKLITENFTDPGIVKKVQKNLDVISINIWGDKSLIDTIGEESTEKKFASKLGVMYTPTMVFLNESGQKILRLNGYIPVNKMHTALDYVSGRHELKGNFSSYQASLIEDSTVFKQPQDPLFLKNPLRLSKKYLNNKPLIVIFDEPDCDVCTEMHTDIFKRKATRQLLEKFDIAVLNRWSQKRLITPDKHYLPVKQWATELNIKYSPGMVFFDNESKEVFRIDGYLKSFHVQSVLDYVSSKAYLTQTNFQRYIDARADRLESQGIHIDLMD